jgi:hypothetical protein
MDQSKKKSTQFKPEPILHDHHDNSKDVADNLIPKYHPELATARFQFLCRNKAVKSGGRPVPGKIYKPSGWVKFLTESDFVIEIALDCWNGLQPSQRCALVDHLLSKCVGTEDEQTGEMKWSLRPPEVQEFPEVAERHGCWNDSLSEIRQCLVNK